VQASPEDIAVRYWYSRSRVGISPAVRRRQDHERYEATNEEALRPKARPSASYRKKRAGGQAGGQVVGCGMWRDPPEVELLLSSAPHGKAVAGWWASRPATCPKLTGRQLGSFWWTAEHRGKPPASGTADTARAGLGTSKLHSHSAHSYWPATWLYLATPSLQIVIAQVRSFPCLRLQ
jgi:hypothetical protein